MTLDQYHARLRLLPCVVCCALGNVPPDPCAELHHLFETFLRNDWLVAPLCDNHHQGAEGIHRLHRRLFFKESLLGDAALMAINLKNFVRSLP